MTKSFVTAGIIAIVGAAALTACKPADKPADPAPAADAMATAPAAEPTAAAAPTAPAATPALFAGLVGVERIPASIIAQMAAETAPHWARCGDQLVAKVVGADGKDEGFIIAFSPAFTFVDAAIDVPSQQQGVTSRMGINLRSNVHRQYFGEGVSRTDISGRTITKAGWGNEMRVSAPLPHWRADEVKGSWQSMFRPNVTDTAQWNARYVAADCAAVPPTA